MLDARETTAYLIECDGDITAIEEVLSCYVTWKLIKVRRRSCLGMLYTLTAKHRSQGSSVLYCLTKLRNLIRYLRMQWAGVVDAFCVYDPEPFALTVGMATSLNMPETYSGSLAWRSRSTAAG